MTAPVRRTTVQWERDRPGDALGNVSARGPPSTDQPITSGCSEMRQARPWKSRWVGRNGAVMIEDHSTYGSYVNEERVAGRTALTVGDRLRLGSPGVTLELIQLVNDDGAPQD